MPVSEFWHKPLAELSRQQWEALCDGCGKCCLVKLQDQHSAEVRYTSVACRYLGDNCRCRVYPQRLQRQPDCVNLTAELLAGEALDWLPDSCAYRLRALDLPLPDWHPLLAGNERLMDNGLHSVRGRFVSEEDVHEDDIEAFVIRWVDG